MNFMVNLLTCYNSELDQVGEVLCGTILNIQNDLRKMDTVELDMTKNHYLKPSISQIWLY